MYISSDHIQSLIADGTANIVPAEVSNLFDRFLCKLKWGAGTTIDWDEYSTKSINLANATERELKIWLDEIKISENKYWVFCYSAKEPCIAVPSQFAIEKLDEIYWRAPGYRYMFGADYSPNGELLPSFESIVQYDGADLLTGVVALSAANK